MMNTEKENISIIRKTIPLLCRGALYDLSEVDESMLTEQMGQLELIRGDELLRLIATSAARKSIAGDLLRG